MQERTLSAIVQYYFKISILQHCIELLFKTFSLLYNFLSLLYNEYMVIVNEFFLFNFSTEATDIDSTHPGKNFSPQ